MLSKVKIHFRRIQSSFNNQLNGFLNKIRFLSKKQVSRLQLFIFQIFPDVRYHFITQFQSFFSNPIGPLPV
ncbi:hypothetical protein [Metabacillus idriensis]|uniref:hypothetical protein n=1 Tax=Metabacillus idriensis TaxID=324768 RepID=UPI0035C211BE